MSELEPGSQQPAPAHAGFSIATLVVGLLAGALITGLVVYPWQSGIVTKRDNTISAMAAAHQELKGQVDSLTKQMSDLQTEAQRAQRHLLAAQQKLAGERTAHRETTRTLARVQGPQLSDGRYLVRISGVQVGGAPLVTFDLLTLYTGEEAQRLAEQDGSWTDTTGKYVVNESAQPSTMPAAAATPVRVTYWNRDISQTGKLIDLPTFATMMAGNRGWQLRNQQLDYWVTVQGGQVASIRARFVPPAC